MTSSTKTLLIGATGPTGRAVLDQAARMGLDVRALARNPDALTGVADVSRGDVLDPVSLAAAMRGVDCVISVLGTKLTLKPVTLLSTGTRHLVAAMRAAGVARLICVTGMGAGDSRGHGGFVYDRLILPLLLGRIYADKDRQEEIVRASGLDWTLVRPAFLTDGPATGAYRVITRFTDERMTKISRADVAHFLVGEALAPRFSRQSVNLSA